ncbi:MAG: hypothetical protein KGI29_02075 [Pseudomonadota bacterium]|nr:hypothetical protein [Pseudomonadota bacterium]MDE3037702.1 hypothetical protein [Pseudomonadota bacterium]
MMSTKRQALNTRHCLRIAHRGASAAAPENTMSAFRKALELGADAVECDVHVSKDGEAVVIHDDTLERTTSGRGRVADFTLKELKGFVAGGGERIPTLEELLAFAADRLMVFIEIKAADAVPRVAELVTRCSKRHGYARFPVIGFNWDTLLRIQAVNANILIGATPPEQRIPADFTARAQAAGMWSVNPCIDALEQPVVDDAHRLRLKIITWTANTPEQIAKAKALGVDGMISDAVENL